MKRVFLSAILGALLLTTSATPQTKSGLVDPLVESAKQENKMLEEKLAHPAGLDECLRDKYKLKNKYNDWFLAHVKEFETVERQFDQALTTGVSKLNKLKTIKIEVLPEVGQTDHVEVTYDMLVAYFKDLNDQMKGLDSKQREALLARLEDPSSNKLNRSHRQILAAMEKMNVNLNTSLRQLPGKYTVKFVQGASLFNLEFTVTVMIANSDQDYSFSLLDEKDPFEAMGKSSRWFATKRPNLMIDGIPLDGRYRWIAYLRKESLNQNCPQYPFFLSLPKANPEPYVSLEQILISEKDLTPQVWAVMDESVVVKSIGMSVTDQLYAVSSIAPILVKTIKGGMADTSWDFAGAVDTAKLSISAGPADVAIGNMANGGAYSIRGGSSSILNSTDQGDVAMSPTGDLFYLQNGVVRGASGAPKAIQIAPVGPQSFFGVTDDGKLYLDSNGTVTSVPSGVLGEKIVYVYAKTDKEFWVLTSEGRIYQNDPELGWLQVTEPVQYGRNWRNKKFIQFVVTNAGQVCALRSDGRVFCLKD